MKKKERLAWLLLGLAALVTRFAVLGDRVPHHDEAVHAHIARELLLLAKYRYDPTYHGPLQFYVMAPLLALFGQNDFVARLWAATCGVGWVLAPLLLRRRIGAAAALATSLLILLSPTLTYYARFAREDTPVGFFTFTAAALLLAGQRSRHYALVPVGVLLALHLASKETFYVYLAVVGPALLATLWVGGGDVRRRLWSWVVSQRLKLLAGVLVFFALSITLYTVFFRHPEDVLFPVKAFTYWWGQHQMERVAGPPWYYLPRLTLYEFLTLGLAAAFFLRRRWHGNPTWLFFLFWGLFSLAMYAYLGEKVPWLAVHQILPWLIPAGAVLGRVLARGGGWGQRVVVGLAVVATLWQNYHAVYANPAIEPATGKAELLVYVQTVPSLRQVIEEGKALAAAVGEETAIAVEGEAGWPLSWSWANIRVWWDKPQAGQPIRLFLCDPGKEQEIVNTLGRAFGCAEIPLRAWWVEEMPVTLRGLAQWWLTRQAWSPLGWQNVVLCRALPEVAEPNAAAPEQP